MTFKNQLREILAIYHDDIVNRWEFGKQYQSDYKDYNKSVKEYAISAILQAFEERFPKDKLLKICNQDNPKTYQSYELGFNQALTQVREVLGLPKERG